MWRRSGPVDSQTGQPSIAATETGPGTARYRPQGAGGPWSPIEPFAVGRRSWPDPASPESLQRGQPPGFGPGQETPPQRQRQLSGEASFVDVPVWGIGEANQLSPQFATPFVNPIGAGVPVPYRTQPSYYGSGQYVHGVIFWTNRFVPTSIPPSELSDPDELAAILSDVEVYQSIQVAP